MAERIYDVIVIGGGPAGQNAADRVRRGGLTACVVESRHLGGECSFYACVPSKALLRPVLAVAATRRLRGVLPAGLDPAEVFARRDAWTGRGDDSAQEDWLSAREIGVVRGRARLVGDRHVAVRTAGAVDSLRARHAVVIAVGSEPAIPPIEGLAAARPWTNRDATAASWVPPRLIVLGGGAVGCEMAQAYAGLGSQVTLVHRGARLLDRAEEFAGELVGDGLAAAGVDVRLGTRAVEVTRAGQGDGDDPRSGPRGEVTVRLAGGAGGDGAAERERERGAGERGERGQGETVVADEVLAALGRRPATDDIGLDTVGLTPGRPVEVDDTLRAVDVPGGWLYAVGDANGRTLLTHVGKYQGRVCGEVIVERAAGGEPRQPIAWADHDAVPQVVFTDPEVASVGLTAAQARARGLPVDVVEADLGAVTGAGLAADGYRGRARLVIDRVARVVIGATFAGPETAELLHSATIAIVGRVQIDQLWHAIPPFPTISEIWLRLLEEYGL